MNLALMCTAITAYASEHPFGSPSPRLDTQEGSIPSESGSVSQRRSMSSPSRELK